MTTEEEYKDACNEFMSLQPSIMEQKAKLNALKKEQKQYIKVIRQYMVDNDLTSVDVGGYEFNREEVEKCAYSEKNFVEFLQNMRRGGKILEEYKETYTQSGEKFKMNRPKKILYEQGKYDREKSPWQGKEGWLGKLLMELRGQLQSKSILGKRSRELKLKF